MNEAQQRAQRAQEILEDPIFAAAWEAVAVAAIEDMISLPVEKLDQLPIYQARVIAIRHMRQELQSIITDGKVATLRQQRNQKP